MRGETFVVVHHIMLLRRLHLLSNSLNLWNNNEQTVTRLINKGHKHVKSQKHVLRIQDAV